MVAQVIGDLLAVVVAQVQVREPALAAQPAAQRLSQRGMVGYAHIIGDRCVPVISDQHEQRAPVASFRVQHDVAQIAELAANLGDRLLGHGAVQVGDAIHRAPVNRDETARAARLAQQVAQADPHVSIAEVARDVLDAAMHDPRQARSKQVFLQQQIAGDAPVAQGFAERGHGHERFHVQPPVFEDVGPVAPADGHVVQHADQRAEFAQEQPGAEHPGRCRGRARPDAGQRDGGRAGRDRRDRRQRAVAGQVGQGLGGRRVFGGDLLQQPPAEAVAQEQHDAFHLALEMLPQARIQRPAAGRRGGRARVEQAHDGRGQVTDRQPIVTGKHDLIGPCRVDRHQAVRQDGVFQLASQLARHAASFVVSCGCGQTEGSLYPILAGQGDSGARAGFSRKRVTNS